MWRARSDGRSRPAVQADLTRMHPLQDHRGGLRSRGSIRVRTAAALAGVALLRPRLRSAGPGAAPGHDARRHAAERLQRRHRRPPGADGRAGRRALLRPGREPRARRSGDPRGRRHLPAPGRLRDRDRPPARGAAVGRRRRVRGTRTLHTAYTVGSAPARQRGRHVHGRHLADPRPLRDHEHLARAGLDPGRRSSPTSTWAPTTTATASSRTSPRASSAVATRRPGSSTACRRSRRGPACRRATSSSSSPTSRPAPSTTPSTPKRRTTASASSGCWTTSRPGETRAIDVRWLLASAAPPGTESPKPLADDDGIIDGRRTASCRRRSRARASTPRSARGKVRVKVPGSKTFVDLKDPVQVPIGSIFDTLKGKVTLISAADLKGGTQNAWFYTGIFKVGQTKGANPVTELTLADVKPSCPKGKKASAAAAKKKSRKLWGDGKGKFRTTGQFSSATVRGTKWVVTDRCDGTLTRVVRGSVTVRDFVRRKNGHRQGRQAVPRAQVQVSWVSVFAGFLVAHMVGDYLFQTDWQARHKRRGLGGDAGRPPRAVRPRQHLHAGVPARADLDRDRTRRRLGARRRRPDLRAAPGDRRRPPGRACTCAASSASTG